MTHKSRPVTAFIRPARPLTALLVGICAAVVVLGASVPTAWAATTASGSWSHPNGDLANTGDAAGSTISSQNVVRLKEAWSFKLSGKGATDVGHYGLLAANPIVDNGVVYVQDAHQDLECNVNAQALSTGALEWKYTVDQPERSGPGPNGVAVAGTRVFGLTPTSAFALDARNGKPIWTHKRLLAKGQGTFGIQPEVATGSTWRASPARGPVAGY